MKNEEKYVDPATIDVKNPIFERLEEDKNNPWVLEEQIKYYKSLGVPIAHYAFPGQKERHYYAVFEGSSKLYADDFNRIIETIYFADDTRFNNINYDKVLSGLEKEIENTKAVMK
jgi:hypothetical protein